MCKTGTFKTPLGRRISPFVRMLVAEHATFLWVEVVPSYFNPDDTASR